MEGTATSCEAPVHVHVDDDRSEPEGNELFQHDSRTAAWAQWRCKHVTAAQVVLITISSIQFYLGLISSDGMIGILPLVSSILGLVSFKQYFTGNVSTLQRTLNWVRLPPLMKRFPSDVKRIAPFLFILDS
jgi:hypothetical protein